MDTVPMILLTFYGLFGIITVVLLIYVLIQRLNQKDDFEDRDN